ncbi:MAG TPA: transposase [Spirochaetota bacterium]|nr:transposase [Spirochaetota bacterium]
MKWIDLQKIADATGLTKAAISKRAQKENWISRDYKTGKTGAKKKQYDIKSIPEEITLKLLAKNDNPVKEQNEIKIEEATTKNKKVAYVRSIILSEYERMNLTLFEFVLLYNLGKIIAGENIRSVYPVLSEPTVSRWIAGKSQKGLDGLVCKQKISHGAGEKTLNEAERKFLFDNYFTTKRLAMKKVYRMLKEEFPKNNASYTTIKRYFNEFPPAVHIQKRYGSNSYNDKINPYVERDRTLYKTLQLITSDHHRMDCMVREGNSVFRPWITAFQDFNSRKIMGVVISKKTPSANTILQSLQIVIEEFGNPDAVYFDNGKDYKSKKLNGFVVISDDENIQIQGVLASLGIEVIFARPYHGQSKPIERWFGTLAGDFSKTMPGYVGSNTAETLEERKSYYKKVLPSIKMTFEEFEKEIKKYIADWNKNWKHSGLGGKTPDEVFNEGMKNRIGITPDERALKDLFSTSYTCKVQRNGVTVKGVSYYAEELVLNKYSKKEVIVKRPFKDVGVVKVYELTGKFICQAVNDYFKDKGVSEENIRNANNAIKKEKEIVKKAIQTKLESHLKTFNDRVMEEAQASNKKVYKQNEKVVTKKESVGFFVEK